jgi:hypothetical protein
MREVELTYTDVQIDEIIVEVAKYIEQGFHVRSWTTRGGHGWHNEQTIELVKY